ncbi:MAG: hypothetical protein K8I82_15950 [Anaerolineae bacterium]|nr:hypothetical protein [Anaerolineae bacterium]
MKKEVGLWIDHRQAVIVITLDQEETVKRITSNMEKHIRYSGGDAGESHNDASEDGRDRRFDNQLDLYYDQVTLYLQNATSILIFGPGEAKVELQKRMEDSGFSDSIVAVKPADKMTDAQIVAEVRLHFQESEHASDRTRQH